MCQEKPVADNSLCQDIVNSEDDGLSINAQLESQGTGTEYTKIVSIRDIHMNAEQEGTVRTSGTRQTRQKSSQK